MAIIKIEVPSLAELLQNGVEVKVAPQGIKWSDQQFLEYAKEKGVYIIYHGGAVKYIGKTDGPSMYFAKRLRREFSESASQNKHNYPKLRNLVTPPPIMVYFITSKEIRKLITSQSVELSDENRNAIFEQVLIQVYKPEFQKTY